MERRWNFRGDGEAVKAGVDKVDKGVMPDPRPVKGGE